MNDWVIREIAKEHKDYSIQKMCRILKVSPSGYYQWCSRGESCRKKQDLELKEKIKAIYEQHRKRYGSPRIHDQLRSQGTRCSRKRVERLIKEMGMKAIPKRQFKVTTRSDHSYPVAQNIAGKIYLSRAQAQHEIFEYFEYIEIYYNRQCCHSAIGNMVPGLYENQRMCA